MRRCANFSTSRQLKPRSNLHTPIWSHELRKLTIMGPSLSISLLLLQNVSLRCENQTPLVRICARQMVGIFAFIA